MGASPEIQQVVAALAVGLRVDGADLTATHHAQHITFQLHIPDAACAECVMPSEFLGPIFQRQVDADLGSGWTIEISDPRVQS